DVPQHVGGDGEAEATVQPVDERVHSDDVTVQVQERTAGVAGVNGGVGLDVIFVLGHAEAVPVLRGNDALSERVILFEGHADGETQLPDAHGVAVGELDRGQVASLHLDDGDVGFLVRAHESAGQGAAVPEADVDFRTAR